MSYIISMDRDTIIIKQYLAHAAAADIAAQHHISTRQVQRIVKKAGVVRTIAESYRIAIEQGRMTYTKKPAHLKKHRLRLSDKLRYKIMQRDGFRCVLCGTTAKSAHRLEIDHIDDNPSNNDESNLQVLCDSCNKGKAWNYTTS